MDAGLYGTVWIAGEFEWHEAARHPAQIFAVDPVGVKGAPDRGNDAHAPVPEPAVHVL